MQTCKHQKTVKVQLDRLFVKPHQLDVTLSTNELYAFMFTSETYKICTRYSALQSHNISTQWGGFIKT